MKSGKLWGIVLVKYDDLVKFLYMPKDPASLGIIRFLFGFLMLLDLPEERGGADIDLRWGSPSDCHFPLFPILRPLSFPYMSLLYGIMWLGAFGIMLGFKFKTSVLLFGIPYWYILLLDKSFWNNHSYLYGIIAILFVGSSANHYFSIDGILDETKRNRHVPYWNYFILKFQFFLLYFLAGLKKTDMEWLEGYSMTNLGTHWVFSPFKFLLTTEQIDYLVVHWFGFLLDLTIGFWLLIELTRPIAMLFCACFHLMNSRLFSIGMFPYVCLATMPLFCEENWPRKLRRFLGWETSLYVNCIKEEKIGRKKRFVAGLLLLHCILQGFLPYSHFITKGYNNWTSGLYGYSWDMMVHSWDTILVVVKVVDNDKAQEFFVDPQAWTQTERWSKHGDMCVQYVHCLKYNLLADKNRKISSNISVYIDVWCSLNKRFQQRMYDPNYDLVNANWSPFEPVEWLLPVLSEYNNLRSQMDEISKEVYSWSNFSDVLFIADFPGLFLENFIANDLRNVTLTVLEGEIVYEIEEKDHSFGVKLTKGATIPVQVGFFHKIHTTSSVPSCYMYIYVNKTRELVGNDVNRARKSMYSPFPLVEDVQQRVEAFSRMMRHIFRAICHVLFNAPLIKRARTDL